MQREDAIAFLQILSARQVGRVKGAQILNACSIEKITLADFAFGDSYSDLRLRLLSKKQIDEARSKKSEIEEQYNYAAEHGARFVSVLDDEYPPRLTETLKGAAPVFLFIRGDSALLEMPSVGFCGSRKASLQGLKAAQDCAGQLAEFGIAVVSGNAAGVDQSAHASALASGGRTIFVLPEGILKYRVKGDVREVWDDERSLIISEFLPNDKWLGSRAMTRNKTIIGLSDAMIVIEAQIDGGTMDAGAHTIKYGKPLFAAKYGGGIGPGNDLLLRSGAVPIQKSRQSERANISKIVESIAQARSPSDAGQTALGL